VSAYVVSPECIGRVLWGMVHGFDQRRRGMATQDRDKLGRRMHELNARAVAEHYREEPETWPMAVNTPSKACSDIQAYKSLRCWLYQCTEGDVPEDRLYRDMADMANAWACHLVAMSDAYEKAGWG